MKIIRSSSAHNSAARKVNLNRYSNQIELIQWHSGAIAFILGTLNVICLRFTLLLFPSPGKNSECVWQRVYWSICAESTTPMELMEISICSQPHHSSWQIQRSTIAMDADIVCTVNMQPHTDKTAVLLDWTVIHPNGYTVFVVTS